MSVRVFLALMFIVTSLTMSSGCVSLETVDEDAPRFKTPTELYNTALDRHDRGHYEKAKMLFHQYINQYPDTELSRVALYYLGHCYQMSGDDKEAQALYQRVIGPSAEDDFWAEMALKRLQQIKGEIDESDEE
jgi:TolA-binding protein